MIDAPADTVAPAATLAAIGDPAISETMACSVAAGAVAFPAPLAEPAMMDAETVTVAPAAVEAAEAAPAIRDAVAVVVAPAAALAAVATPATRL
ncbi:MAG: hypothetical protein KAX84_11040, partial [Burkholderiales bacterium]|nr:hypothetical protein [Burkholderiales bacterium]